MIDDFHKIKNIPKSLFQLEQIIPIAQVLGYKVISNSAYGTVRHFYFLKSGKIKFSLTINLTFRDGELFAKQVEFTDKGRGKIIDTGDSVNDIGNTDYLVDLLRESL